MAPIETKYAHIQLDERGVPIISGTNMKVIELVLEHIAHGSCCSLLTYHTGYASALRLASGPGGLQQNANLFLREPLGRRRQQFLQRDLRAVA
jgi:hypothetical protein